ncbi:hypothetical protein BJ322DRAFT_461065 [Thelephora terrestris]|uniref:Uncharacterized protein n=1 Tax=Thelephora terrestris TaxID=56493 RepID=A0A9P6H4C3_9AGAM|nr:hypothetical protein BJ322DRAFT_461065 [Thelephora terrestris]
MTGNLIRRRSLENSGNLQSRGIFHSFEIPFPVLKLCEADVCSTQQRGGNFATAPFTEEGRYAKEIENDDTAKQARERNESHHFTSGGIDRRRSSVCLQSRGELSPSSRPTPPPSPVSPSFLRQFAPHKGKSDPGLWYRFLGVYRARGAGVCPPSVIVSSRSFSTIPHLASPPRRFQNGQSPSSGNPSRHCTAGSPLPIPQMKGEKLPAHVATSSCL